VKEILAVPIGNRLRFARFVGCWFQTFHKRLGDTIHPAETEAGVRVHLMQ
jgi:hypothetical protein